MPNENEYICILRVEQNNLGKLSATRSAQSSIYEYVSRI